MSSLSISARREHLLAWSYRYGKRSLDVVLCLLALPFAAVALGLCALAIRLDSPGKALFRQTRTGRDGRQFSMLKFRTMVENAEELKESLAHLNILPAPDFKIIDDPRITRVGKFLRRTSLDELPQVLNVLRGDMALVGPRPTSFGPGTYDLWHTERLEATPGITGLWQLRGRNEVTFDERLRMDIEYLDNMSLGLDVKILALTVLSVLKRAGA